MYKISFLFVISYISLNFVSFRCIFKSKGELSFGKTTWLLCLEYFSSWWFPCRDDMGKLLDPTLGLSCSCYCLRHKFLINTSSDVNCWNSIGTCFLYKSNRLFSHGKCFLCTFKSLGIHSCASFVVEY